MTRFGSIKVDEQSVRQLEQLIKTTVRDDIAVELQTALAEAISNALLHGRPPVYCHYLVEKTYCSFMVRDNGDGWNHAGYVPAQGLEEHGRGVFMMQSLMDKVVYNHKGNAVYIARRWSE